MYKITEVYYCNGELFRELEDNEKIPVSSLYSIDTKNWIEVEKYMINKKPIDFPKYHFLTNIPVKTFNRNIFNFVKGITNDD